MLYNLMNEKGYLMTSISAELKKMLSYTEEDLARVTAENGFTVVELLAKSALVGAIQGDVRFFQEVITRLEGKAGDATTKTPPSIEFIEEVAPK